MTPKIAHRRLAHELRASVRNPDAEAGGVRALAPWPDELLAFKGLLKSRPSIAHTASSTVPWPSSRPQQRISRVCKALKFQSSETRHPNIREPLESRHGGRRRAPPPRLVRSRLQIRVPTSASSVTTRMSPPELVRDSCVTLRLKSELSSRLAPPKRLLNQRAAQAAMVIHLVSQTKALTRALGARRKR